MSKRIITKIHGSQTPAILQPKIKVCAYVRISTEHLGQLNSLRNQTEYYERKLKSNPAYGYIRTPGYLDIRGTGRGLWL